MPIVSFDVTTEEADLIHQIAKRANQMSFDVAQTRGNTLIYTLLDADMDIAAVHANGLPAQIAGTP